MVFVGNEVRFGSWSFVEVEVGSVGLVLGGFCGFWVGSVEVGLGV